MTDDLVKRLRLIGERQQQCTACYKLIDTADEAADRIEHLEIEKNRSYRNLTHAMKRIEKLEAALQQCEIIAEQYQKENEWRAEITNGTTTKAKARAVAARCGMLLGSQRKVIRKALEGKDE